MTTPSEMWDRRFSEHPWPSEPDPLLVELAGALPPGRGVDLGSGPGRNGLWLAANGWSMTLLDASAVALRQAEASAAEHGTNIQTVHGDVLDWEPAARSADLVVVANLHPGPQALPIVLARAADALVAGGHLFVVGHDLESLGRHGPPDPERLYTVERLREALPATVWVDLADRRRRVADDTGPDDGESTDVAVLVWATKRAA
jgi:SAM-dependent methyltransferase